MNLKWDTKYNAVWKTDIFNDRPGKQYGNKLRTYRLFKNNFAFESDSKVDEVLILDKRTQYFIMFRRTSRKRGIFQAHP
jgi:hypothetical protein